ncbi:MAG TPA: SUF system Fe-S cluster assembly protein [Pelomicrobium sp.]|nr:SUF system Fe-S cluster assembly protein [Pelomicrobium sp.]
MANPQQLLQQDETAARETLEQRIVDALRQIFDPEIPVNIYDLGLIYGLEVEPGGEVGIQMTLTAPGCPVAQTFPQTVQERVAEVPGVKEVKVELTWEPPWTQDRMTEAAKLQLGML